MHSVDYATAVFNVPRIFYLIAKDGHCIDGRYVYSCINLPDRLCYVSMIRGSKHSVRFCLVQFSRGACSLPCGLASIFAKRMSDECIAGSMHQRYYRMAKPLWC
jgi:hypothetical protein